MRNKPLLFTLSLALTANLLAVEVKEKQKRLPSDLPANTITPQTFSAIPSKTNLYTTADFIYWYVKEEGLEWRVTQPLNPTNQTNRSRVKGPNFHWEPGFKFGVGAHLPKDGWDLFVQYTNIHTGDANDKVSLSSVGQNTSLWRAAGIFFQDFNKGFMRWDHTFSAFDLEVGRSYKNSSRLTMRPFLGLKGSWQIQEYYLTYTDDISAFSEIRKIHMEQIHRGIGLRAGLETSWQIVKAFSIFANVAINGLWTNFEVLRMDSFLGSSTDTILLKPRNDFYTIQYVTESMLGVKVEASWKEDRYHGSLQLAFEQQLWRANNQFVMQLFESAFVGRTGDLSLQGLTLKARLDF